jgi:hypothetical protein
MPTIENLLQASTVKEQYALVYTPNRKRKRFAANCVFPQTDKESALANTDSQQNLYPALICGPSKSSEGFMLYYLIQWLDAEKS